MPTPLTNDAAPCTDDPPWSSDEVQVATAALLARDNGRTLEAYRHDLRSHFRWAADQHLAVLDSPASAAVTNGPGCSTGS